MDQEAGKCGSRLIYLFAFSLFFRLQAKCFNDFGRIGRFRDPADAAAKTAAPGPSRSSAAAR